MEGSSNRGEVGEKLMESMYPAGVKNADLVPNGCCSISLLHLKDSQPHHHTQGRISYSWLLRSRLFFSDPEFGTCFVGCICISDSSILWTQMSLSHLIFSSPSLPFCLLAMANMLISDMFKSYLLACVWKHMEWTLIA